MIDIQTTMTLIVGVILVVWVITQQKFKGKMLCYFIRPNRVRIKKFVPLTNKHVRFEKSKYVPAGLYRCDPNCITMEWFSGGLNKIFPVFIPTLEFKWDTPNPLDPKTFESTWHTPEARDAAWEEHQHVAFARQLLRKREKLADSHLGFFRWL